MTLGEQCSAVRYVDDEWADKSPFTRCGLAKGHIGDHRSNRADWARSELCQGPYPRFSCDCDACEGARAVERSLGVKL